MDNLDLLKKVQIFKNLSDEQLSKFAAISMEESYPTGDVIIEEGAEGKALYIVKRGTVAVSKVDGDLETELTKLVAGEHFGEMSLIEDSKTSARVKAYNDVETLTLARNDFMGLMERDDSIAARVYRNFTRTLSERLRQTSAQLSTWKPDME